MKKGTAIGLGIAGTAVVLGGIIGLVVMGGDDTPSGDGGDGGDGGDDGGGKVEPEQFDLPDDLPGPPTDDDDGADDIPVLPPLTPDAVAAILAEWCAAAPFGNADLDEIRAGVLATIYKVPEAIFPPHSTDPQTNRDAWAHMLSLSEDDCGGGVPDDDEPAPPKPQPPIKDPEEPEEPDVPDVQPTPSDVVPDLFPPAPLPGFTQILKGESGSATARRIMLAKGIPDNGGGPKRATILRLLTGVPYNRNYYGATGSNQFNFPTVGGIHLGQAWNPWHDNHMSKWSQNRWPTVRVFPVGNRFSGGEGTKTDLGWLWAPDIREINGELQIVGDENPPEELLAQLQGVPPGVR